MKTGILLAFAVLLSPHIAQAEITPFTSDGCSVFIDQPIVPWGASWSHCCVAHDLVYWRGGPKSERRAADQRLVSCVNRTVGDSDNNPQSLGWMMWLGVQLGGAPYEMIGGNPFDWRWGYGWNGESKYKAFSVSENENVLNELLRVQENLPHIAAYLWLSPEQIAYVEQELKIQITRFNGAKTESR